MWTVIAKVGSGFLKWFTGTGVKALTSAYQAKLNSRTESERIAADVEIKHIEDVQDARQAGKEVRLATANFIEMRVLTVGVAFPFIAHLWAVGMDTIFKLGWQIDAFPAPFDEWQGAILLSFFGVAGGVGIARAIAGAIAYRRRK